MNDPYLILGVTAGTSKTAIKLAYRRLAQKYHPDRNDEVGAEEKFKLIKGAYVFLTTGKSDGTFGEPTAPPPKPKPRPKPKPKEPPAEVWQTGYGAKNVERVQLLVQFGDTFAGVMMRIGSSLQAAGDRRSRTSLLSPRDDVRPAALRIRAQPEEPQPYCSRRAGYRLPRTTLHRCTERRFTARRRRSPRAALRDSHREDDSARAGDLSGPQGDRPEGSRRVESLHPL